jgi:tryptophanyl-tRNA synthetase
MTETILSIFLGIGLASASGFRVFLPMFAMSLASYFQVFELNESFQFIAGLPALITLGIATIAEIFGYYIPFIDNLLDTIATPLAAIAGTIVMASTLVHLPTEMTWILAIIAGGGTASAMQGMTSVTRLASSVKTAGLGNPIVATAETGTATAMSALAIFVPIVAIIFVVALLGIVYFLYKKFRKLKT